MSFKPAVKVIGNGSKWSYNGTRFATHQEALDAARELMSRWVLVIDIDAHESDDPVNYQFVDGKVRLLTADESKEA